MTRLFIILGLFFWSGMGNAALLEVDLTRDNSVVFYAGSTMGNFEGKTSEIEGYISREDNDTLGTGRVHFEVDLRTMDSGIGLRNTHMRDKYLDTAEYPMAVFEGRLSQWRIIDQNGSEVTASGMLKIHGVEMEFSPEETIQLMGDIYRISSNFELNITDFNINQPKFLFTSMKKVVRLRLVFYLKTADTH